MVGRLALVALAGAAGTVARYGVHAALARTTHVVVGTLVVNLLGCLALGVAWGLLGERGLTHGNVHAVLVVGALGAFTTFSALVFETAIVARDASPWLAATLVVAHVAGGLALVGIGVVLARVA